MEEIPRQRPDATSTPFFFPSDGWRLLVLLVFATILRAWQIGHTEVTARDGVGFMRYAWELRQQPWTQVFRNNPHPPLYPLTVLGMSFAVRGLVGGDDVLAMQYGAQLAAALAGTLLVIPMFFLGRELFSSSVGFWGCILFQCLPASSRVLADALSEGLWLLLIATALLLALRAFRNESRAAFGLAGVCSGLAYLARPEGLLVAVAIGAVLIAAQVLPRWRRSWSGLVGCALSLALGTVAAGGLYSVAIGRITNKTTGVEILQTALPAPDTGGTRGSSGAGAGAAPLAVYWFEARRAELGRRLAWSLKAVLGEYIKGFGYFAWLPAIVAVYWCRAPLCRERGAWAVFALCLLHTLVLWRVAYVAGYVSERHSLPIVLFGLLWGVAGAGLICSKLDALARYALARIAQRQRRRLLTRSVSEAPDSILAYASGWYSSYPCGHALILVILIAQVGIALPKSLERLHGNRAGFHAAGLWLAEHARPMDNIVDPFAWAEYYSGRALQDAPSRRECPSRQFVVMGASENEHARLPLMPTADSLAARGQLVYRWQPPVTGRRAEEVRIYCVGPEATP